MKNVIKSSSFTLLLFVGLTTTSLNAQEVCQFAAKVSVQAISAGAFAVCLKTGNPAACEIGFLAIACAKDRACNGVAEFVTKNSCQYTVERIGDFIHISGVAYKQYSSDLRRTYNSLNSVSGITWLMRYLN